jgi:hypothetical protein
MKGKGTGLVLTALLVVGAVLASEVSVDNDASVDFSVYKTFAWKEGTAAPNPSSHGRIVASVEKELTAKGLKKVDKAPDLWVGYQVAGKQEATSTDYDYGKFKFRGRNVSTQMLTRGTLVVNLLDGKTGNLVWRAAATDYIPSDAPPGEGVIEKAVSLMFTMFPPKKD